MSSTRAKCKTLRTNSKGRSGGRPEAGVVAMDVGGGGLDGTQQV